MKEARKNDFCLNCNHSLCEEDNFCPNCGQENKDQKVPFWVFISDFFANYLNFESLFFRTVPAFLLKPGKLTIAFNEGKRRKYLHPIRLYLILSLFYFFAIGIIIPPDIFDRIMVNEFSDVVTSELIDSNLETSLSEQDRQELDSLIKQHQIDSIKNRFYQQNQSQNDTTTNWMELKMAAQDPQISDSTFYGILNATDYVLFDEVDTAIQRNFIANSNLFIISSAQNLPIMMFVLLPFFALLLKLLYFRRGTYYVEHLIEGLHMHSFAYLIYGCGIFLFNLNMANSSMIIITCFVLVSTYAYISMMRIHRQHWLRTLLKFWVLGFVYFSTLFIAIGIELYVSLRLM